ANELDVLEYWRTTGIAGNQILAYAAVDTRNLDEVRQAIWLFGGIYLGIYVPQSAERQFAAGEPWTVPWVSPIVGAHAVPALAYDESGVAVSTWAKIQGADWRFFSRYCEEAYAIVDQAWIASSGISPSGFDVEQLKTDLAAL